jgi:trk system potassium uptake protein TrkA
VVLEEAGAHVADLLVAATGEDEDNLVISLLAKRQFGVDRVVARINEDDNAWLFDDRWGVDVAVPAAAPLISLIEEATGAADTVALLRLGRAGVNLIETVIDERSAAARRRLADVPVPAGCVVAAVVRDGVPVVPDPGFVLLPGDELLVVAQTATEQDVHRAFQ